MQIKKLFMVFSLFSFMVFSNHVYSDFLLPDVDDSSFREVNDDNFQPEYSSDYSTYDEPDQTFRQEKPRRIVQRIDSYNYDLPYRIHTNEKVILVDPNLHAWGAYAANGKLLRAGRATAGSEWCGDIDRPCKTRSGVFRIYSLGSSDCVSSKYPIDEGGGAPMPYCMYFNGPQGLHGSNHVVEDNVSHGCVRLRVSDAKWLRYNFSEVGTKVIIKSY
jgi:hypothetical protein